MSTQSRLIFGIHAVQAMLEKQPQFIRRLYLQQERQDKKMKQIASLAKESNVVCEMIPRLRLENMAAGQNHQGVIAECAPAKSYTEDDLASLLGKNSLILILDGVQDPHNLGACFRSADAAGVDVIIAPKDNAAGITSVVSKVASGAAEVVPFIQVTNLARCLSNLKELGVWIYGAAGEASQNLYQVDFTGPTAIVLGAEGSGLRRLTREHCDLLVHIPMTGSVSSLNVSVAAGVFLFEVVRQRLK